MCARVYLGAGRIYNGFLVERTYLLRLRKCHVSARVSSERIGEHDHLRYNVSGGPAALIQCLAESCEYTGQMRYKERYGISEIDIGDYRCRGKRRYFLNG